MSQLYRRSGRTLLALTTGIALIVAAPVFASPGKRGEMRMTGEAHACNYRGHRMSRLVVSGSGEARVAPDLAQIQLGVTTQADSASDAMQQNSDQQSSVIEALKNAGVAAKDIQTSGLRLHPRMDYPENSAPTINGYEASNMVTIRVTDVSKLGDVLDSIVEAGANQIQGISFERSEPGETDDEALRAAVADAQHKAGVMADASGMRLGPVLSMQEAPVAAGPGPMMMRAEAARDASTPVEAGELSLSARVQIEYALIGKQKNHCDQDRMDKAKNKGKEKPEAAEKPTPETPANRSAPETN